MSLTTREVHGPALALSGSNPSGTCAFSAAVRTRDGIVTELPRSGERGDLALLVQRACAAAGIELTQLAAIRLDCGPGSYIGLRVAVTFARTLCTFAQVQLEVTDTLQLIAAAALTSDPALAPRRLVTVLDGRQGRLHLGIHQVAALGRLETHLPPSAVLASEVATHLQQGDAILAPPALAERVKPLANAAGATLHEFAAVNASMLFAPTLSLRTANLAELEPLYLMGSYVS
jgi:tRNA A37 threonylcarbamoyladenosine modification protein TsaB